MRWPVALGVMSSVKKTTNWSGFAPLKNGPATVSPWKVLSATQSSDFLITGPWPTVSLPSPSTETMLGSYSVRITSKFLPCLQSSTNLFATVRRLMVDSNGLNVFTCEGEAAQGAAHPNQRPQRTLHDGTPVTGHVGFSNTLQAIPYLVALGDKIVIRFDHQKCSDLLLICHFAHIRSNLCGTYHRLKA